MSIKKVIREYLDSSYKVIIGKNYYIITNKFGDKKIEQQEIHVELIDMGFTNDEISEVLTEWYSDGVKVLNEHFNNFVAPYKIKFIPEGVSVVDENDMELDLYQLIKVMEPYYGTEELVRKMYEHWMRAQIIQEGDKQLGMFSDYKVEE
jgi:spore coat polysaccharide biosynthesis predicted glycosyltransferase SpsG